MSTMTGTKTFLETMHATSVPARDRAQMMTYMTQEQGLDLVPGIEQLLKEADDGRKLKAKAEEEDRAPLCSETFLGSAHLEDGLYAVVTSGNADTFLPCNTEEIHGLELGDPVLLDVKNAKLAGTDGHIPSGGDIVTVESVPRDDTGCVVVKYRDDSVLARLPRRLQEGERPVEAGDRVVYDPLRRIVRDIVDSQSDGTELLTDPAELDKISRDDLGAVHAILDEMLFRMKLRVLYPEWVQLMGASMNCSYLLAGATGTGKTIHVNVLARCTTDFVEELTGQRVSRLVTVDASSFFDPLFGVTQQKIASFFDRLKTLASKPLTSKDGGPVQIPLIVVLEECEALFRTRGEFGGSSHLFDRPLAFILQKMSAVGNQIDVPVIFVATTNLPNLVDPAARRRFGVRQAIFGTLSAGQAASVLGKKIPAGRPLRDGKGEVGRQAVLNQVLAYLYGDQPAQGVAEVQMQDGTIQTLRRRNLVTGSMLHDAVMNATDEVLRQSAAAGRLQGLDGEGIVRALHDQFASLAATLRPNNLREHCPHWFTDESIRVVSIRPLMSTARRPPPTLIQ